VDQANGEEMSDENRSKSMDDFFLQQRMSSMRNLAIVFARSKTRLPESFEEFVVWLLEFNEHQTKLCDHMENLVLEAFNRNLLSPFIAGR
jgi:hypothetical protein